MKRQYEITLILSEENVQVLTEALNSYKGKSSITAACMISLIKRQVEIQKTKQTIKRSENGG